MTQKQGQTEQSSPAQARKARLKAALKANMARRKAQARGRNAHAQGQETSKDK